MISRAFLLRNARYLSVGALLTFLSSFGQTYFISVFAGEIRTEFGISHGEWGSIYALGTLASAIVMVWAGALTDRVSVRVLGGWVLVGLAFACVGMATNPYLWMLPVLIFFLRLFGQGMASHIGTVAIARWFTASRGRALAVASLGYAVGEAFLPLMFVALLAFLDWRVLWILAAAITLGLLPFIGSLLKSERTPSAQDIDAAATGMLDRHWKRSEVMRNWVFWMMVPAIVGPSAFVTAFFFHQVHLAETKGWDHLDIVALFPLYTLSGVGAMLMSGVLIDRFGTGRVAPYIQIPLSMGFFVFALNDSYLISTAGLMLMALASGANSTLPGAFWAEFYGTRHLGSIKALAVSLMVFGSAIGPAVTGAAIDLGYDFEAQMQVISIWFALVALLLFFGLAKARRLIPTTAKVDVIRP